MNSNSEKETILIVDDIRENIDVLNGLLKRDYDIKFATNGKMAVSITRRFLPDLILMDIIMPEMDGFEATKILKADPLTKDIPIIFVTAKDEDFDEAKGFELGGVDYITKPISPIVMKGRVKTQLALYNQKKQLAMQVKEKTKELLEARLEIIRKLGIAAEYKDNVTGNHVVRMSKFCYYIAKAYGFDQEKMDLFLHTSPMHDIGKIGIPDRVLQKPGKLDEKEWEIIKTHCAIGADIIGDTETELMMVSKIVAYQHHERWNGKGYPEGLKGEDIHIYARIVAIADVFDALVSPRPYKKAWEVQEAVEHIKSEAGKHFDPEVVKAFVKALPDIERVKEEYA
jgi:putative two-component system response regulator